MHADMDEVNGSYEIRIVIDSDMSDDEFEHFYDNLVAFIDGNIDNEYWMTGDKLRN